LAFVIQPSGATAGGPFAIQPVVAVEDAQGNVVSTDTSPVALSITPSTGSPGAALSCAADSVNAQAGIASFSGCEINTPGTYTLHASDGNLAPADSTVFTIGTRALDHLAWSPSPIAPTGSLGPKAIVTLSVTAFNVANQPISNVLVFVSLQDAVGSDAKVSCFGAVMISAVSMYCPTGPSGQVSVGYTSSAFSAARGSDVVMAAVDSAGTEQADDQYTYVATFNRISDPVASLSWSPNPVASAGSLRPGQFVGLSVTAFDRYGSPLAGAPIALSMTSPPGSNAVAGCSHPAPVSGACGTDSTGTIRVGYTTSKPSVRGGSDIITATAGPGVTAQDLYSYA
jgi:trimeric autotransporter adhesin